MDYERHVTLRIPEPEDFDATPPTVYVPVPSAVVDYGIDVLQAFVTQWKQNEGGETVHEVWDPLAVAAAQMLSRLMGAWAAYYHGDNASLMVEQIAWFCHWPELPKQIEALRHDPERGYIADALVAVHEESERRRKERAQQRAAPQQEPAGKDEQEPAGKDDGGWDF